MRGVLAESLDKVNFFPAAAPAMMGSESSLRNMQPFSARSAMSVVQANK